MTLDLLIIGQGLAGMSAACYAIERGMEVGILARGRGGLSLWNGLIDYGRPGRWGLRVIGSLPSSHPLRLAGAPSLGAALASFNRWLEPHRLALLGIGEDSPMATPTALGCIRHAAWIPLSMLGAEINVSQPMQLLSLAGLRDFDARLASANLRSAGYASSDPLELSLPFPPPVRDQYATDLARLFDDPTLRQTALADWQKQIRPSMPTGLPAMLGLDDHPDALDASRRALGDGLFEIATLPPCLPGLRIERALRRRLIDSGVRWIEGSEAIAGPTCYGENHRLERILIKGPSGSRSLRLGALLLASGGFLHGGLQAGVDGRVVDSVFQLPAGHDLDGDDLTASDPFAPQPYTRCGLKVDAQMRPLRPEGIFIAGNVFAAGGILAGADPAREGWRQAIDLATAWRAVQEIA
jgi:glycerol-3-phosphate dehydrogenase subunit B